MASFYSLDPKEIALLRAAFPKQWQSIPDDDNLRVALGRALTANITPSKKRAADEDIAEIHNVVGVSIAQAVQVRALIMFAKEEMAERRIDNTWDIIERALAQISSVIGGHGVEAIRREDVEAADLGESVLLLYVNLGETYAGTIYYDFVENAFGWGSWGAWLEEHERHYRVVDEHSIDTITPSRYHVRYVGDARIEVREGRDGFEGRVIGYVDADRKLVRLPQTVSAGSRGEPIGNPFVWEFNQLRLGQSRGLYVNHYDRATDEVLHFATTSYKDAGYTKAEAEAGETGLPDPRTAKLIAEAVWWDTQEINGQYDVYNVRRAP